MSKDYKILVDHILESIEWIEKHAKNTPEYDFLKSTQIQDSVIRRLEIIRNFINCVIILSDDKK